MTLIISYSLDNKGTIKVEALGVDIKQSSPEKNNQTNELKGLNGKN